jgi:hypothetical protein
MKFQAQRIEKIPFGPSFQHTRSHLPSSRRKEDGVHQISSIHSGDLGRGKIHSLPVIRQLYLTSLPRPESMIVLSPKTSTRGPKDANYQTIVK